jgi:hypothetical protein
MDDFARKMDEIQRSVDRRQRRRQYLEWIGSAVAASLVALPIIVGSWYLVDGRASEITQPDPTAQPAAAQATQWLNSVCFPTNTSPGESYKLHLEDGWQRRGLKLIDRGNVVNIERHEPNGELTVLTWWRDKAACEAALNAIKVEHKRLIDKYR